MDKLDIRILRAMGIRPYGRDVQSPDAFRPAYLARKAGTTTVTAKDRLARMEALGVIRGYQVYPNLRHLGLSAGGFQFHVQDENAKERALADLRGLEGLNELHNFVGPNLCVDLSYPNPEELKQRLVAAQEATGDEGHFAIYHREMPLVKRPLSRLDWRILGALRGDAKRSLVSVAQDLDMGYRTVKRHFDRMAAEGSLFRVPLLDLSRAPGVVPCVLVFRVGTDPVGGTLARVLRVYGDTMVSWYVPASLALGHLAVMAVPASTAELEDLRVQGAAVLGVERLSVGVFRGMSEHTTWLDPLIQQCLATASSP